MIENCCFTGHRHLPDAEGLRLLKARTEEAVRGAYRLGARHFYAGGALGFDMLAEECVCALRDGELSDICLHLLLPCHDQDKLWPERERMRYRALIERADSHVFLYPAYQRFVMAARNRELVKAADLCIAYLQEPVGGTAQTVSLAKKKPIPVINVAGGDPLFLEEGVL